ncbi:MAG TPA: hypothetical protein VHX88_06380 [Solirubrobacteraceae bacterium]|nr:hypothetical protein [Solirubrobacteraceae bacterium]
MRALRARESRSELRRGAVGRQRGLIYTRTIAILGLAFLALIFYIGYEAPNVVPGRSYYNLYTEIPDADNIAPHYEVRIGGELAGQVLNPKIKNHLAYLHLQLAGKFKYLRASTKVELRLRSPVGVRYVDLIPGTTGPYLKQNGVLGPSSEVTTPVNIDNVLDIFDSETRTRTQQFMQELGTGLMGQGQSVNGFLHLSPGFFSDLGSVSAAIDARPQAMHQFISSSQALAAAFEPVRETAVSGYQPEIQALQVFTNQGGAPVESTLDQLPPTLTNISSTMPSVNHLLAQATSFADQARSALANAPTSLTEANSLLRNARTPLRNLSTTLSLGQQAVPPTLTLLKAVPPALPTLDTAFTDLTPTLSYLDPRACEISNGFTGWGDGAGWGSGQVNFIQFYIRLASAAVAGSTLPAPLGGDTASSTPVNPYPGPCSNNSSTGNGEGGPQRPTAEQFFKDAPAGFGPGQTP